MKIKVIAFDADDTLWVNEPYFQETEQEFCRLLYQYIPPSSLSKELLTTELSDLPLYGYGIKGFTLSMIETAINVTGKTVPIDVLEEVIKLGKALIDKPVELLEGVEEVLIQLKEQYRLVVATKGDLLDQERKLKKSGLAKYFHHIEIMSDKKVADYQKLIKHLDIQPEEFLMVGNSVKSDILPVIEAGAYAYHIPFHILWSHEHVEEPVDHPNFRQLQTIKEVLTAVRP